jgi:paraquat-inducible protein B
VTDDRQNDDDLPEARSIRSRWPGLVWAVPLAALIIVAFLGIRALTRHGVDVKVTFGYAEGVTPGNTKVLVSGVEAGEVSKIRVSPDAHHVEVTLRLDPREKAALNSNTKFWLIGENPTITDIQSIRAAVAGVIIAMAPGTGGTPTRTFTGLDQPPIIPPDAKGTAYYLTAPAVGSLQAGAAVSYHGLAIGKIVDTAMVGLDQFRMQMFINAPYDRYVKSGAEFWTGSPLKLSLSGASISAGLASPASVLQGSVQFEVPHEARTAPQAPAGTSFTLYDDQSSAEQGPTGPEIPYRLILAGAAGDLSSNSTVSMLGYTVGRVRSAKLQFAPGGKPYTEAVFAIFPRKLDIDLPKDTPADVWRATTDRAVSRLLAQGYRAHMVQSPPLVGSHVIELAADRGTGPASLGHDGGRYPLIPVAEGGGADDLISSANQILAKINRIPLDQIGANLGKISANIAQISGSGQVRDSIAHLDGTLKQLDGILTQVKPQIGPLMTKLNQTADELHGTAAAARTVLSGEGAAQDRSLPDAIQQLDEMSRSIRSLTDYLGRHPEALIRGKAKEK